MRKINTQIISWINSQYKFNISGNYYDNIKIWLDFWRGFHQPFHQFYHNNGNKLVKRELYGLKMGKKVCEDWVSILLNSKTKVIIDEKNKNDFIQGEKEKAGITGKN